MSGEQIVQRPIGLCRDVTRELDLRSFGRTDRSRIFNGEAVTKIQQSRILNA